MNALTFEIAGGFAAIVFIGNLIYDKKNKNPVNWKRGLIMALVSFVLTVAIGAATE